MKEFFENLEEESPGDTEFIRGSDINKGVRYFGNEDKGGQC